MWRESSTQSSAAGVTIEHLAPPRGHRSCLAGGGMERVTEKKNDFISVDFKVINMYETGQFLHFFFSFLIEICFVYKSQLTFRNLWFTNQYWNNPQALPASAQLSSRSLLPSCGHLRLLQVLGKLSKVAPTMWAANNVSVMYHIRWHLAVGTQVQSCVTPSFIYALISNQNQVMRLSVSTDSAHM